MRAPARMRRDGGRKSRQIVGSVSRVAQFAPRVSVRSSSSSICSHVSAWQILEKKTSRTTAYRRLAPHSHNPRGSQHPPLGSVSYARDLAMRTRSKPPYNTEFLCMDHRTASLYSAMHTIDFEQNFGTYELVFVITEITPFRKY
jgi:hypothetical protein